MIRKTGRGMEKVEQEITLGDSFLKSAENNLKINELEVCEIIYQREAIAIEVQTPFSFYLFFLVLKHHLL